MKILLVNERVRAKNVLPSLGIAILATIAKRNGHKVKAIDYQITTAAPPLDQYVKHLKPDIVGIRIVNENWHDVSAKIDQIRPLVKFIIVGGPFPTLHFQELKEDPRIDTIFVGEAETTFLQFLKDVEEGKAPKKIYWGQPKQLINSPLPNFTLFHNYRKIEHYPLQTSRGCPFNCSFCMTKLINSQRWRRRSLFDLVLEIHQAINKLPNLKGMSIIDDNPTHDYIHFTNLLEHYKQSFQEQKAPPLSVLNIRADKINSSIAQLLRACDCKHIILGVETIGKKAMRILGKQIYPSDVLHAKKILQNAGITVGGSFIVGLPGDDWCTVNETIKFAEESGLNYSLWGHLLPFKHSKVRERVKVLNDYAETMVAPNRGRILTGTGSETRELPQWWQIKAWLRGNIKTNPHSIFTRWNPLPTLKIFFHSIRYAETHHLIHSNIKFMVRFLLGEWRTEKHKKREMRKRAKRWYCNRCKRFHMIICPKKVEATIGWSSFFIFVGLMCWIGLQTKLSTIVFTYSLVFVLFAWVRLRKGETENATF